MALDADSRCALRIACTARGALLVTEFPMAPMQIFSLMPPADGWRMHLRRYPVAQYRRRGSRLVPELADPPQQVAHHLMESNLSPTLCRSS